jgi:hypothetical protein
VKTEEQAEKEFLSFVTWLDGHKEASGRALCDTRSCMSYLLAKLSCEHPELITLARAVTEVAQGAFLMGYYTGRNHVDVPDVPDVFKEFLEEGGEDGSHGCV